jgi:hypothetical protein
MEGDAMSEAAGAFQRFCPQCRGTVDADSRFCKHCAYDLAKSSVASSAPIAPAATGEQKIVTKPNLLIAGVAAIALVTLGFTGAYIYKRNRTQPVAANTSATTANAQTMGDRAKQVEEKILRGDTLSDKEIEGLSAYELRVLRNVHFARYGRKYETPGLGDYFNTRPWYKPSDSYNDSMITANDKVNISLLLAAENRAKQSEMATSSNSTTSQNTTVATNTLNQSEATSSNSSASALTDSNVQRAVRSFMNEFTKGGNINVEGVQELPNQNAATADLRFVNWVCSTTYEGGLSKQNPPPVTYDRYGMPSSAFGLRLRTYNTTGLAVLKRYNDGRWVLKEVRVGSGFNTITITGTAEVR